MSEAALRWHVLPDSAAMTTVLMSRVMKAAHAAIADRGVFHLVLSGGSTPRALYGALADTDSAWADWRLYFTDERCLPPGDPERNDTMARSVWLNRAALAEDQVIAIPAELGPEQGAWAYAAMLNGVGQFDVTLLGLGDDGHTASLFPGHPLGDAADAPDALGIANAPKPPPERVSMSAQRLSRSREALVIVSGAGKRDAVRSLCQGAAVPLAAVRPVGGVDVFLDAAAAVPDLLEATVLSAT